MKKISLFFLCLTAIYLSLTHCTDDAKEDDEIVSSTTLDSIVFDNTSYTITESETQNITLTFYPATTTIT